MEDADGDLVNDGSVETVLDVVEDASGSSKNDLD